MKTALVLLLSLHLGSCCPEDDYLKGKQNYPKFTCREENGTEVRLYEPSVWIRTDLKDGFLTARKNLNAFVQDFQKKYKDLPKVDQFDKTWPVVINHTRDNQLWMSWFVPLELDSANSWLVPLRKFSGLPSLKAGKENMKMLLSRLDYSCPDLDHMEYSGAGYESYFSIVHHNEVWIRNSSCSVLGTDVGT